MDAGLNVISNPHRVQRYLSSVVCQPCTGGRGRIGDYGLSCQADAASFGCFSAYCLLDNAWRCKRQHGGQEAEMGGGVSPFGNRLAGGQTYAFQGR